MDLQGLVERLMEQHRVAFARLLGEIEAAYDEVVALHSRRFPDPRQIPGGMLCGDVRATVLAMNGMDALTRSGESTREIPKNASGGPDSTLRMTAGPNSSVRLGDSNMAKARVRKLAPAAVDGLALFTAQPNPAPKPGVQLFLDDGADDPVMGPPGLEQEYELLVYWWPTWDKVSVAGAILAAVADLDTNDERILVFTALPAAIRPRTEAEEAAQDTDYQPDGDFNEIFGKKSTDTGDPGA